MTLHVLHKFLQLRLQLPLYMHLTLHMRALGQHTISPTTTTLLLLR